MTLFRRMFLGHVTVLIVAIFLISTLLNYNVERILMNEDQRKVSLGMNRLVSKAERRAGNRGAIRIEKLKELEYGLQVDGIYLIILDPDKNPLYYDENSISNNEVREVIDQIRKNEDSHSLNQKLQGENFQSQPLLLEEGMGNLILYLPNGRNQQVMSEMRYALFVGAMIALLVSVMISFWLSKRLSVRIKSLRDGTKSIKYGNYDVRIPTLDENDEIKELAEDFNEMANQLALTQQELQAFEQSRSQFLLDISHELRTPLTSIRGWLEALRKGYVEKEEQSRVFANMEKETLRLTRLIQELMDLEKIRSGKMELNKQLYHVDQLFSLVHDQLYWMAEDKGLKIKLELPTGEQTAIFGDYDRILQILVNLTRNAIQFTEQGRVTLRAEQRETETIVSICDTGQGMSKEEQKKIWERFFKVDPSRVRKGGETGLGLAIVKQLVEAHGGKIFVQSEKESGSCFIFVLPMS
ncbi:HAMP domain-containing histidine kinase [Hazenella sp. IB182357]|uniref:Circadian input-output histidine kinase CikA n=1 Tax=Polycladospora coralii TaxID=2771432 RepID=A0A926RTA8_9BACL|nr:HAMP domain-containing sensor histidine kinase [Polycladospora coralii]MBD1370919.1 HAMP domain-containing histidine kinase [Polycladospora coralii]MBS7529858.1 HAMP domain-containing histidine kinase [Polycladospora coralii]